MKLTMSKAELAEACPSSLLGTQTQAQTPAGARGRAIHGFIRAAVEHGQTEALEEVPREYFEECAAIDLALFPPLSACGYEVKLAYSPSRQTGRALVTSGERDYAGAADDEIPGTADLVAISADEVIVLDLKTGFTIAIAGRISPARRLRPGSHGGIPSPSGACRVDSPP